MSTINVIIFHIGETADIIVQLLERVSKFYQIERKFVAFSADNAPTNFGSVRRTGEKNVFKQLKDKINPNMIGAGCTAHILHNAIEYACDQLAIDVEYIAVKIYTYFYRHTVRLHNLKQFCESIGETYVKLVGYSKTRFLELKECLSSIIENFEGLKEYFKSVDAPVKIAEFFEDPFAKATFIFVRDQAANFQSAILELEGNDICAIDAVETISRLMMNIESRLRNNFISSQLRSELTEISVRQMNDKMQFIESTKKFHQTTLNYLNERIGWLDDAKVFSWIRLNSELNWTDVENSVIWMSERNYFDTGNMENVFNQFVQLESYLKAIPASHQISNETDKKWVEIFRHFAKQSLPYEDLAKVIEFALTLPATNAPTERVFSHINDIWTPDKGSLLIENVRARLMVKFNWQKTCLDFYNEIKGKPALLRQIGQSEKYNMKGNLLFESVPSTQTAMEVDDV